MSVLELFRGFPEFPGGNSDADRKAQAAYWIAVLGSDRCRPAQRKSFQLWLDADDRHVAAYDDLKAMIAQADMLRSDPDMLALRADMLGQGINPRRTVWKATRYGAIAAMAIAGLITAGIVVQDGPVEEPLQIAALESPTRFSMQTEVGERLSRSLPDGSTIDLNTDSQIRVDLSDDSRNIYLLRGQAVFDVAHDESRPFTVYAGDRKVTALGTLFEVHMQDLSTQVTLLEGKVRVDEIALKDTEDSNVEAEQNPIVEMLPGERYVSIENSMTSVSAEALEAALSWREGRHIFANEKLSEIVLEFNRYTTRTVVLKDPAIGELVAGMNLRLGSTRSLATALEANFGLSVTDLPENDHIIIDW